MEHASNVLCWYKLEKEIGIKVKFIPLENNFITSLNSTFLSPIFLGKFSSFSGTFELSMNNFADFFSWSFKCYVTDDFIDLIISFH